MKRLLALLLLLPTMALADEISTFSCDKDTALCIIPVYMIDSTDNVSGKTGLTASSIYYSIDNGASTSLGTIAADCTIDAAADWCEVDATNQAGLYLFGFTATSTAGLVSGVVHAAGALDQPFAFRIVTANSAQTGDSFSRLGAPSGASISADISALPASVLDLSISSHRTAGTVGGQLSKIH